MPIINNIRSALLSDHIILLEIWSRAVKATHLFLTQKDIEKLYQGLKNEWLKVVDLWVLEEDNQIIGFIGFDNNKIEMLFIDDNFQAKGYGTQLIEFAKSRYSQILLDVNEQNPNALAFYQKQQFNIVGRSETDTQGNPFPILHMIYQK